MKLRASYCSVFDQNLFCVHLQLKYISYDECQCLQALCLVSLMSYSVILCPETFYTSINIKQSPFTFIKKLLRSDKMFIWTSVADTLLLRIMRLATFRRYTYDEVDGTVLKMQPKVETLLESHISVSLIKIKILFVESLLKSLEEKMKTETLSFLMTFVFLKSNQIR